jgi:predicted metal-dependent peptidase
LSHFARRNHRQKHRWDVACDYAVNMILDDERMLGPDSALHNAAYRGLSAEEIYPLLHEDPPEQTLDRHLFDDSGSGAGGEGDAREPEEPGESGDSAGETRDEAGQDGAGAQQAEETPGQEGGGQETPPPPPSDPDALDEQWKNRLAAAALAARQAGKLSQSMLRLIDHLLAPQLPWRALLARYLMSAARDDYSFQRTSRRDGAALMPRLYSQGVRAVVVLDTSGSIGDAELREFLTEVDALKAQVRAEIILHACDDKLAENGPWTFAMWETLDLPDGLHGHGGTDFRPVFAWLERARIEPDLLVYFTDAEGRFPEREPAFPVIWLVKGKAPTPFGVRIQLN